MTVAGHDASGKQGLDSSILTALRIKREPSPKVIGDFAIDGWITQSGSDARPPVSPAKSR
jgi:hypothetical protein